MSYPLVSVLVPAYNAERHVGEAVTSALRQTHPNVEVVVVDDGSADRTLDVLRPFETQGVRVIVQDNAGACEARNRALAEARGDYVQYLDADDLLSPDKIERQVSLLERSPAGCVSVSGITYFKDGTDPAHGRDSPGYPALDSDDPVQWLLDLWTPGPGYSPGRWGMVQTGAWLVPRAVADAAGPWDAAITQDQDGEYFARVLLAASGVRWAREGRVYYRKFDDAGSVSGGRSGRHLAGRIRAVDSKARHVMPRTTAATRAQAAAALARQYRDVAFHAYPAYQAVFEEAEWKARRLGGYEMTFLHRTRMKHVERLAGWKVAKRLGHSFHALKSRLAP